MKINRDTKLMNDDQTFSWPRFFKCKACLQEITISQDSNQLAVARGNTEKFITESFHLVKCSRCLSINSIDTINMKKIYHDYPVFLRKLDLLAKPSFSNLLNRLKKQGLSTDHRILDVGCGNGIFLKFLGIKGYKNIFGFDPFFSDYSAKPRGLFDFVILNDVIEHVDDPREILNDCKSWLAPGGVLYVGTTCSEFVDMQNPKPSLMLLHQPFHRVIFSKPFLFELCREEGFIIQSSYVRSYMDTLYPFANYRFLDEFNKALGQNMDKAFKVQEFSFFLKHFSLFFYAFFGYFFPSAHEPAVLLKLKVKDS
jgi:SAM-dependent methyltransferase